MLNKYKNTYKPISVRPEHNVTWIKRKPVLNENIVRSPEYSVKMYIK
jgi:hypothetical protein